MWYALIQQQSTEAPRNSNMLIIPNTKFVFVHIPRTAGNFITRSIVSNIAFTHSFHCSMWNKAPIHRHSTIDEIRAVYPEIESYDVFAVHRDYSEIIQSDMRLWQCCQDHQLPDGFTDQEKEWLSAARLNDIVAFKKLRWDAWIGEDSTPWDFWCDNTVKKIPYERLSSEWTSLCKRAGCESEIVYERIDWQKRRYSSGI